MCLFLTLMLVLEINCSDLRRFGLVDKNLFLQRQQFMVQRTSAQYLLQKLKDTNLKLKKESESQKQKQKEKKEKENEEKRNRIFRELLLSRVSGAVFRDFYGRI